MWAWRWTRTANLLLFVLSFFPTGILAGSLNQIKSKIEHQRTDAVAFQVKPSPCAGDLHLLLQDVVDDHADLPQVRGVYENLLLARLDDAVHGFQDAHHNLAFGFRPHVFHEARDDDLQEFLERCGRKSTTSASRRAALGTDGVEKSLTLMVGLCGTILPCSVLSSAKLPHGTKRCTADIVMGILGIHTSAVH